MEQGQHSFEQYIDTFLNCCFTFIKQYIYIYIYTKHWKNLKNDQLVALEESRRITKDSRASPSEVYKCLLKKIIMAIHPTVEILQSGPQWIYSTTRHYNKATTLAWLKIYMLTDMDTKMLIP